MKIIEPAPIQVELTDLDGKKHTLTARPMTRDRFKGLAVVASDVAKMPVEDQVAATVSYIYGGKKEDYFNFDIRSLKAAMEYFNKELANPTA